MRALQLTTGPDLTAPELAWVEAPDPKPGPGEVLLAVRACGVCGSDVHCVETGPNGRVRYSGDVRPPVILGHEFAGEVVGLGDGARAFREERNSLGFRRHPAVCRQRSCLKMKCARLIR